MTHPVAVRLSEDGIEPIDLSRDVRDAISQEAAYRRLSANGLIAQLLEAIVFADLFGDVLKRGQQR